MLTPCVMLIVVFYFLFHRNQFHYLPTVKSDLFEPGTATLAVCPIYSEQPYHTTDIVVIVVAGQLVQHHVHHLQHHPLLLLPECQGAGRVDR